MPKRLELLSELVPQAKAIAQLVNPDNSNADRIIRDVQEAVHTKGVQLVILKASTEISLRNIHAITGCSHPADPMPAFLSGPGPRPTPTPAC